MMNPHLIHRDLKAKTDAGMIPTSLSNGWLLLGWDPGQVASTAVDALCELREVKIPLWTSISSPDK